ncbi:MAG: winged helix-turn-helix transcriptional regulator, partial [Planktomarina sp.]|nr:winged helix-turn-helix transcriptional regulator [Planktomarina sp.]
MLKEVFNNRINPITASDSGGYGPILRPTEREISSLRQQIFELIRASGRIPRSSIARALNVSPGSITALTADLIADGF